MLLYVKGNIQCKQMVLPENGLECVGVTICLSPEISFNVVVLYRPPNEKDAFFYMLKDVLKVCSNKETIFMGDFNLNWLDKTLPWLNERLWLLMKDRDAALKKYIKSKPTCLMSTSSLQFWN